LNPRGSLCSSRSSYAAILAPPPSMRRARPGVTAPLPGAAAATPPALPPRTGTRPQRPVVSFALRQEFAELLPDRQRVERLDDVSAELLRTLSGSRPDGCGGCVGFNRRRASAPSTRHHQIEQDNRRWCLSHGVERLMSPTGTSIRCGRSVWRAMIWMAGASSTKSSRTMKTLRGVRIRPSCIPSSSP
jgi:hypothetical protein